MRFRRNIIPLGSSAVCSARAMDGCMEFYLAGNGVVVKKIFDLSAHTLTTQKGSVAYTNGYLALEKGSVQNLGEVVYESYR